MNQGRTSEHSESHELASDLRVLSRRSVLRTGAATAAFAATGFLPLVLEGCGGGGGHHSKTTTQVPFNGAVDTTQIGGSGLVVTSAYSGAVSVESATGGFKTTASGSGAQIISVSDDVGATRGLKITSPSRRSQGDNAVNALSTAEALVYLTPGIISVVDVTATQRLGEIRALASFSPLVSFLSENLATNSLSGLTSSTQLEDLKGQCIQDWFTLQSRAATKALDPSNVFSPSSNLLTVELDATGKVTLTNLAFRFLSVVRQPVDVAGNSVGEPSLIEFNLDFGSTNRRYLLGGAEPIEWSSLATSKALSPNIATDNINLRSFGPTVTSLEYWAIGLGRASSLEPRTQQIKAELFKQFGNGLDGDYFGPTVFCYVVGPFIDLVLGDETIKLRIYKIMQVAWPIVWEAVHDGGISDILDGHHDEEVAKKMIDIADALEKAFVAAVKDPVLAKKLGLEGFADLFVFAVLERISAVFSVANAVKVLVDTLSLPALTRVKLPISLVEVGIS